MLRWNRKRKGFTLVELVIVIAILGILAMYALPKYQGIVEEARSSEARAQLGSFRSALGIYYAKNGGKFPAYTCVKNGDIFAEGTVPEVEVTLPGGSVIRSKAVKGVSDDGDATNNVTSTDTDGGWVYDDGGSIAADDGGPHSKADVRLNSTATDPANSNTEGKRWYEY